MCNRRELEGLIVMGLEELKRLEAVLTRQWRALANAPGDARDSFLSNLAEFQQRGHRLEMLVDALSESHRNVPMAS